MKISICCVGKVKESYFRGAIEEYSKRLGRYCRLEFLVVAVCISPVGACAAEEVALNLTVGDRRLSLIIEDAYVIALAIDGKKLDSVELSDKIAGLGINGVSHIQFVIGGSLGLHESVLKRADFKLSFSDMTFPHQLMRVILLEQIYRSYRIINNEPYHK